MVISANLMVKAMVGQENNAGVIVCLLWWGEPRLHCQDSPARESAGMPGFIDNK